MPDVVTINAADPISPGSTTTKGEAVIAQNSAYGDAKMWYNSVELWTATIAIVAFIAQGITGKVVIPSEIQGSLVAILMVLLRTIRPASPLAWSKKELEKLNAAV